MSPTLGGADKNRVVVNGVRASPARPYLVLEGPPYTGAEVRTSLWTTLLGGGHFFFHDDEGQETPQTGIMGYDPHVAGGDVGAERRMWLGHASRLLNGDVRDLDAMLPHNELCPEGAYCLAAPGSEYIVYVPPGHGGKVGVDVSATQGSCLLRLYDPRTGDATAAKTVTGGGALAVALPDEQDWVVHVTNAERAP